MSDILESKGYLYITTEGRIMSVTIHPLDLTDLKEVIITKRVAQLFMDGTMSMYDWTATIDDNGYTLTSNRNVTRNVKTEYQHPSLIKIGEINFINSPIIIIINHTDNSVQVNNQTDELITFYMTKKDDPSILYKSITVEDTVTELLPTTDIDIYSFKTNAVRIIHED